MELSQEAHHLIVRHVRSRPDLVTLSTVSKRFQKEAERALYDTLHLRGFEHTISMCRLLASTPRLQGLVAALSIFVADVDSSDEEVEEEEEQSPIPDDYWEAVAAALRQIPKLRFLSIFFEQIGDTAQAWVLDGCTFRLETFHCDFEWDAHLASFLDTQTQLSDLYLADFRSDLVQATEPAQAVEFEAPEATTSSSNPLTLPKLSILECTFTEAVAALVPGRPVVRVKTCFSRTDLVEKRVELRELHAQLKLSRQPLRALDLADESYTPEFSLELLDVTVNAFSSAGDLRYLGTLVLPVDSVQRLEFYASLMNLPLLQCIEVDVSEWEPAPMTPAALRALMFELRIYCPTVARMIFVYDFDRVVMKVEDNRCVLDSDAAPDTLWREV